MGMEFRSLYVKQLGTLATPVQIGYYNLHSEPYTQNFTAKEYRCKCSECGTLMPHLMDRSVVGAVQLLRTYMNMPLTIRSAYRCSKHPDIIKRPDSQHGKGLAVDIACYDGATAYKIIHYAITVLGCTGFSYNDKLNFVHLDWRTSIPVTYNY